MSRYSSLAGSRDFSSFAEGYQRVIGEQIDLHSKPFAQDDPPKYVTLSRGNVPSPVYVAFATTY